MSTTLPFNPQEKSGPIRLVSSLSRADWAWVLIGCFASFEIANLVLLGWSHGLYPVLKKPYLYAGDALYYEAMMQRAIEGFSFNDPRMGFPFGSAWYDFPNYDLGNFVAFKFLGGVTGSVFAAINLYFLLGFPAVFASSFLVLRWFGVKRVNSACFGLLFAFAPYHFARFFYGHIPYTWYFCVPIVFYCGYRIYEDGRFFDLGWLGAAKAVLLAALLSLFGTYFAFFSAILLMLCGVVGSFRHGNARPFFEAAGLCALVTIGVAINLAPAIGFRFEHGVNLEAVARSPAQTEAYSLKIFHMLMPSVFHRVKALSAFAQNYDSTFPLPNPIFSSLGVVGDVGFLAILFIGAALVAGKTIDGRLRFALFLVMSTVLICTVGGLNDFVAVFITPLIRGWDRFSIFVNFGVLLALAVLFEKCQFRRYASRWVPGIAAIVLMVGILDQTPWSYRGLIDGAFARYDNDASFVAQIEETFPHGAAMYQLPYVQFPEAADMNGLSGYELLSGFLTSKNLRWSFGGIKGREGDLTFRDLAAKSPADQVSAARKMGFSGIYIDKRGYADGGGQIVNEFGAILGKPALSRADGNIVVFKVR